MVAILGMTTEGWDALPKNERQRAGVIVNIKENAEQWSQNTAEVNEFTARYLNAMRSSEADIERIAQDRFRSDVTISK